MVASEVNTDLVLLIFKHKMSYMYMPNKYDIDTSVKQLMAALHFLFSGVYINIK